MQSEVADLLTVIAALDRRPFPKGAEAAWAPLLERIDYRDAEKAVQQHYAQENAKPITPGDIRGRAAQIKASRHQVERRALPAPQGPVCTPEVKQAALAQIRNLTAHWSDLERGPRRKVNTETPTSDDSEITEEARIAALRALERIEAVV